MSTTALPSPIQSLLDLFAAELPDVRFGDMDAATLARAAEDVASAAEVVASAQSALDAARVALQERHDALLVVAQRALAYARVYADGDETLAARLDAIALPRSPRRPRGETEALVLSSEPTPGSRPRGRPRKVPAPPIERAAE